MHPMKLIKIGCTPINNVCRGNQKKSKTSIKCLSDLYNSSKIFVSVLEWAMFLGQAVFPKTDSSL